jgi:hypothetical protein
MLRVIHWCLGAALVTGCAEGSGAPPDTPAAENLAEVPTPATPPASAPDGSAPADEAPTAAAITREGVLEYKELPRTKSVAAYMGVEFTLRADDGETALAASQSVPHEQLVAHDGKRIRVTCTPREPTPANPMEPAPMGPDGAPLARPTKCAVTELSAL